MRNRRGTGWLWALILGLGIGLGWGTGSAEAQSAPPGQILKLFSVGGVLTADGTLWQYTPSKKWQTIDEAFKDQGKQTKILPLPVPAESIQEMVTFGFILTTSGDCWLYDLETDVWEKLDPPR
jgi:hypothetical protein